MWLPGDVIAEVNRVASVYYLDRAACVKWNERRSKDELRLLTGWTWMSENGRQYKQGFKTPTVAYRDAYYTLIRHTDAQIPTSRPRPHLVTRLGKVA